MPRQFCTICILIRVKPSIMMEGSIHVLLELINKKTRKMRFY
jgi:hypothetical protein